MRTPEGLVADALCREAKKRGFFIRKCKWEGRLGAPDYVILHQGKAVFIETKAPGEVPRKSQTAEFEQIRAAGCSVYVVDSADGAKQLIQDLWRESC